LKKAQTKRGTEQDILFLTSHGVYHLLYTSKKDVAKKFRKWVGDILDDIIFNESRELTKQLVEYRERVEELERNNKILGRTMAKDQVESENAFVQSFNGKSVCYLAFVTATIIKFGWTDCFKNRLQNHKSVFPQFKIVWVIECKENKWLEKAIKNHVVLKTFRVKMEINNVVHNELIELKNGLTFEDVRKTIVKLKDDLEQSDETKLLLKQCDVEDRKTENVSKALDLIKSLLQSDSSNLNECEIDTESQHCSEPESQENAVSVQTPAIAQDSNNIQVERKTFPLPVFPPNVDDMCEFYNAWQNNMRSEFDEHVKRFRRPQWVKCFGEQSSTHKLRHEKTYNWLYYLDTLEASQAQQVIQMMTNFADKHNLSHSCAVKQVFYLMVRPDSKRPSGFDKLCSELFDNLKQSAIPLPTFVVKQVHNFK
jgi:hypothetical protein